MNYIDFKLYGWKHLPKILAGCCPPTEQLACISFCGERGNWEGPSSHTKPERQCSCLRAWSSWPFRLPDVNQPMILVQVCDVEGERKLKAIWQWWFCRWGLHLAVRLALTWLAESSFRSGTLKRTGRNCLRPGLWHTLGVLGSEARRCHVNIHVLGARLIGGAPTIDAFRNGWYDILARVGGHVRDSDVAGGGRSLPLLPYAPGVSGDVIVPSQRRSIDTALQVGSRSGSSSASYGVELAPPTDSL